ISHVERTSTHNVEMPQHIIDMYLCKDGKTIHNSSEYEWSQDGDNSMNATFRNRDLRLLETVAPPYKVIPSADNTSWEYTSDPKDREFMDIMGITRYTGFGGGNGEAGKHKVFPLMNWSAAILKGMPHFFTNNGGQGFLVARSGNYVYRYYNVWDNSKENEGTSDVPLFKIDEVMLNYAEAKFEKGGTGAEGFNQTVADLTINKLRDRVGVAHMKVAEINAGFDPKRDQTVDPVLWEIRRERIVELMGEGFGFYDVRRWKKAPWFINKIQYGQWATKEQIGDSGQFVDLEKGYADTTGKKEGFIYMYNDPLVAGKGWLDKYYLYQVPTNEIALNPELAPNNPGWE
ncbi:RagB/SusD family nutrient uptake outer membrane protein, partial [Bacteroides thetaiotaomicron]|uniref:RagB/SusD family nutrient uptake outer membrane protein n=1 Tax=Bacteroides thetaiotaomicron TaxID=818 RepID=UPI0032C1A6AF